MKDYEMKYYDYQVDRWDEQGKGLVGSRDWGSGYLSRGYTYMRENRRALTTGN